MSAPPPPPRYAVSPDRDDWSLPGCSVQHASREAAVEAFRALYPGETVCHVARVRSPRPVWELVPNPEHAFDAHRVAEMLAIVSEHHPEEYAAMEDGTDLEFLPIPASPWRPVHDPALKAENERRLLACGDLATRINAAIATTVKTWCEVGGYVSPLYLLEGEPEEVTL